MQVVVGGVVLDGAASSGWLLQDLLDWYRLPEVKSGITERPIADGAFVNRRELRRSLQFSLTATYLGESEAEAVLALQALRAATARGPVAVTVTDAVATSSRQASVRGIEARDHHGRSELTVSIDFVAFDPARYGPQFCVSTGLPVAGTGLQFPSGVLGPDSATGFFDWGTPGDPGQVTVTNVGSADAFPLITVTGVLNSGFEVVETQTGNRVRLDWPVVLGSQVAVDVKSSRAIVDGQGDVSAYLTMQGRFSVPAVGSRTYQFASLGASSGAPSLQVCVAPAYL